MEQAVKLRLGLALLLAQLILYYYVPKTSKNFPTAGHGDFCRVSPAEKVCHTPITALLNLCPLPRVHFTPRSIESKDGQLEDDDDDEDDKAEDELEKLKEGNAEKVQIQGRKQQEENEEDEKINAIQNYKLSSAEEKRIKEEKQNNLIYQLIVVLLVVSVTASLADCFHERSRRKANPEAAQSMNARGEPTLNRRMSLADLTMQRHARRESQASFRPPAGSKPGPEDFMGRRSSSQDNPKMPGKPPAPSRQKSCPAPFLRRLSTVDTQDARDAQEGSWAEKRRVRMIQRH